MTTAVKVYERTCPTCGKVITSLYEAQAENNFRIHKLKHEVSGKAAEQGALTIAPSSPSPASEATVVSHPGPSNRKGRK